MICTPKVRQTFGGAYFYDKKEKKIQFDPKLYGLYENGELKTIYPSHKKAKGAKHYYKTIAYNNMLDLEYEIKPL